MKRPWIAMLLWAPLMGLQAPSSFAQSLFDCSPTRVMIHNIESTGSLAQSHHDYDLVLEDAGNALGAIVLRQLPNLDRWDWGFLEPRAYPGNYSLLGKGTIGLATAPVSGPEEDLNIQFNQVIEPGQTVNVVFRGFNPQSSIYHWSTELLTDGEDLVRYVGPNLRLNVYEQDLYR